MGYDTERPDERADYQITRIHLSMQDTIQCKAQFYF